MQETKSRVEMAFAGDRQVIDNILLKNQLIADGDPAHKEIRSTLVLPGGGQRGVIHAGLGVGIENSDIVNGFCNFVALSAGAPTGYYTLAGEAKLGATIYYDDNVTNRFVNFYRPWNIMDIRRLGQVFRYDKPINVDNLKRSRPNFLVGLTKWRTGEGLFFDAKCFPSPIDCVVGSICVPYLNTMSIFLENERYVDGDLGNPLPITYAIEELQSTDILVAMTLPISKLPEFPRKFTDRLRPGLFKAMASYGRRYNDELKYLTGERPVPYGVNIAAIYPKTSSITPFTMNRDLLIQGAETAREFTENLFRY